LKLPGKFQDRDDCPLMTADGWKVAIRWKHLLRTRQQASLIGFQTAAALADTGSTHMPSPLYSGSKPASLITSERPNSHA
jgi:hypothetical protein